MKTSKNSPEKNNFAGKHLSYWLDSSPKLDSYKPLKQNLQTEVVIVGGGIAGITTAYCLAEAGKKVVLIEDGKIGSGETGHTTAHFVTALDDRYAHLEKLFGEEDTRLIADSHKSAIQFVEETINKENIECHFKRVPGYLFRHPSDLKEVLKEELPATKRAGINARLLPQIPGMIQTPGSCIEFSDQAQFHPLLYLKGLCQAIEKRGGKIYTDTHADNIDHNGIETKDGYAVNAQYVVVATNTPVNNLVATHLKQTAFRTYVIAGLVKKGLLPNALWWDTGDHDVDGDFPPYHYARLEDYNQDFDLLISGGEDHPTGDIRNEDIPEEDRYMKLEVWTKHHFPVNDFIYRWSGQVIEPVDSLAFIGRNPLDRDNVFIITGDSGTGMTHGTIGGMLIRDLIMGIKNPWEDLYRPSRFTLKSSDVFFKELLRGITSLIHSTPKDERVKELFQIPVGEARICRLDGYKCGVFRDKDEEFHIVSARCTHLGATLHWNADEKSWDCPWHGSRFTADGRVLNGPANNDLSILEESEVKSSSG